MKLIKTEFKAWLETKKPDDIVGKTRSACSCPLAKYLREQTGKVWFVGGSHYNYAGDYYRVDAESHTLPIWAESFMDKVDERGLHSDISADEALKYV